jgi:hypothetical protein
VGRLQGNSDGVGAGKLATVRAGLAQRLPAGEIPDYSVAVCCGLLTATTPKPFVVAAPTRRGHGVFAALGTPPASPYALRHGYRQCSSRAAWS